MCTLFDFLKNGKNKIRTFPIKKNRTILFGGHYQKQGGWSQQPSPRRFYF